MFKLPSRLHVKVLFILAPFNEVSELANCLTKFFIGVYDGTAWPPISTPKVVLAGAANANFGYGKDFIVDAWGNYVVVWNTYTVSGINYLAGNYASVYTSDIDCRDMTAWLFV